MRYFILTAASSALLTGCTLACTAIGCSGSLELSLLDDDTWEDGSYTLTVEADGLELTSCTFSVPSDGAEVCGFDLQAPSDTERVAVVPTGMNEDIVDAVIDVTLERDGVVLLAESITPEWSEPVYPNGRACDRGNGCVSSSWVFDL